MSCYQSYIPESIQIIMWYIMIILTWKYLWLAGLQLVSPYIWPLCTIHYWLESFSDIAFDQNPKQSLAFFFIQANNLIHTRSTTTIVLKTHVGLLITVDLPSNPPDATLLLNKPAPGNRQETFWTTVRYWHLSRLLEWYLTSCYMNLMP